MTALKQCPSETTLTDSQDTKIFFTADQNIQKKKSLKVGVKFMDNVRGDILCSFKSRHLNFLIFLIAVPLATRS